MSMHARATPLLPAAHHACEATVNVTVPAAFEIENCNRQKCREAPDETGWSTNGLHGDLRRRLLECCKLKRIKKKTKTANCAAGHAGKGYEQTTMTMRDRISPLSLSLSFPLFLSFPLLLLFFPML
jgi:hypothetical protein